MKAYNMQQYGVFRKNRLFIRSKTEKKFIQTRKLKLSSLDRFTFITVKIELYYLSSRKIDQLLVIKTKQSYFIRTLIKVVYFL